MQTKELIEALRKAEGSETLRGVYLGQLNAEMICKKAADALEATLWRDMPAPNNMDILVHYDDGTIRLVDAEDNDYTWLPYTKKSWCSSVTHWRPLTPPEAE